MNLKDLKIIYLVLFLAILTILISAYLILTAPKACLKQGQSCLGDLKNCCSGLSCLDGICSKGEIISPTISFGAGLIQATPTPCGLEDKDCGPGPCGDQSFHLFYCPVNSRCQVDRCNQKIRVCREDLTCRRETGNVNEPTPAEKCSFKSTSDCGGPCGKTVCKPEEKCLFNTCDPAGGLCALDPRCQ